MFTGFIWLLICIISFAYMCLGMLQAVVLHYLLIMACIVGMTWLCKPLPGDCYLLLLTCLLVALDSLPELGCALSPVFSCAFDTQFL